MSQLIFDVRQGKGMTRPWWPAPLRWLLLAHFLMFGTLTGTQSVVWEDIKGALVLSDGPFGTAMLVTPLVGFCVLIFGHGLLTRWSRWQVMVAGLLTISSAVLALALAQDIGSLLVARALSGLGFALLESGGTNTALDWEEATGRKVVGLLYAAFSGGTVLGSLLGGALLTAGWSHHHALLALAAPWLLLAAATALVAYPPQRRAASGGSSLLPLALLRDRRFVVLLALCLAAVSCEALTDMWSVIYLRGLGADPLTSSATFALFSSAMIVGRLANTALVGRWGVPGSLLLAAAGVAGAAGLLAVGGIYPSAAAFVLLGLSVAGVMPTLLSASRERLPEQGDAAAGGIVAASYLGFVLAPPLLGWLAEGIGLGSALLFALVLIAATIWWFRR